MRYQGIELRIGRTMGDRGGKTSLRHGNYFITGQLCRVPVLRQ